MKKVNKAFAKRMVRQICVSIAAGTAVLATLPLVAAEQQAEDSATRSAAQPAEDSGDTVARTALAGDGIEEMVVSGRQRSSAADVVTERLTMDVAVDLLGLEQIGRVGDGTVAAALRRVPGVTLVNDQFIYVRGLGERYVSSRLNGAVVPSPDLTRDVLPLDIFPTSIIESLSVQKVYSPDAPAAFGGGSIDIRTRSIPDQPVFEVSIGSGTNGDSRDKGLQYSGGDDDALGEDDGTRALPGEIADAIQRFQGDISPENIFRGLQRDGRMHTFAEAEAINRDLAASLNRDYDLNRTSLRPDVSGELSLGNSWYLGEGEDWQVGALAVVGYDRDWRNRERITRTVTNPVEEFSTTQRTIEHVTLTGAANFGVKFGDEQELATTSMLLRDSEDEASLTTASTFNFRRADGRQLRDYGLRFEDREVRLHQVRGRHVLGTETMSLLGVPEDWVPTILQGTTYSWYLSKAKAETDIPNEAVISAEDLIDPVTGELLRSAIRSSGSAADVRFSALADDVESYGWELGQTFAFGDFTTALSGGWDYSRKGRSFAQTRLGLGTTALVGGSTVLAGTPGSVFSDDNVLDVDNGFELTLGGLGTESYLAAQTLDAVFVKFDVTHTSNWRIAGGVRWEQFQQLSVPIDPLEFDPSIGQVATALPLDSLVFDEEALYPALAATYNLPGFWAEEFQLRLGWSRTAGRPDLREVSESTYVDPLTEARVRGNAGLEAAQIDSYDMRAEWFFAEGDNLTVSLFYKDIEKPIETVQRAGSDQNLALGFINAESGYVYGLELEWLKRLDFLDGLVWSGDYASNFFVAGNLTLSDSEIEIGAEALDLTSERRRMTQHSEYVANVQLGFDSPDGAHSASMVWNVFGERVYFAGRNGGPDAFEQPFHSLDVVYSWYPMEELKLQLKVKNLLDEDLEVERGGVVTLEQTLGRSVSASLSWKM